MAIPEALDPEIRKTAMDGLRALVPGHGVFIVTGGEHSCGVHNVMRIDGDRIKFAGSRADPTLDAAMRTVEDAVLLMPSVKTGHERKHVIDALQGRWHIGLPILQLDSELAGVTLASLLNDSFKFVIFLA